MVVSINCAFSQKSPVYGFCTLVIDGSVKKAAISDVFDVRYLPTNGISINDDVGGGRMSLNVYYMLIAKKWFNNQLVKNGYDWSNFVDVWIGANIRTPKCPTGNEKGCLVPTENDAEIGRDNTITAYKNAGWTVICINSLNYVSKTSQDSVHRKIRYKTEKNTIVKPRNKSDIAY